MKMMLLRPASTTTSVVLLPLLCQNASSSKSLFCAHTSFHLTLSASFRFSASPACSRHDSTSPQNDDKPEEDAHADHSQQPSLPSAPPFLPRIGPFIRGRRALSLIRSSFLEAFVAIGASRLKNSFFQAQLEDTTKVEEEDAIQLVSEAGINDESVVLESIPINRTLAPLGFSFSAAGLLFPYHLGVAECLIQRGFITDSTPLSGSSAGAIVSAVIASGVSMQEAMLATKELAADCRANGTVFRLGVVLRGSLERCLPEDSHIRCSGRIQVAITQLFRSPRGLIVEQFDSKNDLIDALQTSSFIPGYVAPRPVTVYKKRICIDGGLTLFMPSTTAETTIRICAFPAAQLGLKGIGISPDCNPTPERASPRQLLNWALEPASDEVLDKLFDLGYQDALVWAEERTSSRVIIGNARLQSSTYP